MTHLLCCPLSFRMFCSAFFFLSLSLSRTVQPSYTQSGHDKTSFASKRGRSEATVRAMPRQKQHLASHRATHDQASTSALNHTSKRFESLPPWKQPLTIPEASQANMLKPKPSNISKRAPAKLSSTAAHRFQQRHTPEKSSQSRGIIYGVGAVKSPLHASRSMARRRKARNASKPERPEHALSIAFKGQPRHTLCDKLILSMTRDDACVQGGLRASYLKLVVRG